MIQLRLPLHRTPWEVEYETIGPIVEFVDPRRHICYSLGSSPVWRCGDPEGSHTLAWHITKKLLREDQRRIDMGSGPPEQTLPGALAWDLLFDRDMRDVSSLEDASFDLLYCGMALEHPPISDIPDMLRGWVRLMAPGGEMLLVGCHRCSLQWSDLHKDLTGWHTWAPTAAAVGNILIEAGMSLVDYRDHECQHNVWWVRLRR